MLFILLARLTDDGLQACLDNPDAFADACNAVDVPGTQLPGWCCRAGTTDPPTWFTATTRRFCAGTARTISPSPSAALPIASQNGRLQHQV